jgi:CheY-like chemotaxis protein
MSSIATDEAHDDWGAALFVESELEAQQGVPLRSRSPRLPDLKHRAGSAATTRRTIVVVDDDEAIGETLKDILEEEGYVVEVVCNGVEAMALVSRMPLPPCLIILDLSMPWMDGNAVFVALKADAALSDVPVIISTSDPARAPEGIPVLAKPVDLEVLLETVRKSCSSAAES